MLTRCWIAVAGVLYALDGVVAAEREQGIAHPGGPAFVVAERQAALQVGLLAAPAPDGEAVGKQFAAAGEDAVEEAGRVFALFGVVDRRFQGGIDEAPGGVAGGLQPVAGDYDERGAAHILHLEHAEQAHRDERFGEAAFQLGGAQQRVVEIIQQQHRLAAQQAGADALFQFRSSCPAVPALAMMPKAMATIMRASRPLPAPLPETDGALIMTPGASGRLARQTAVSRPHRAALSHRPGFCSMSTTSASMPSMRVSRLPLNVKVRMAARSR